jgi:hypothetical protein
MKKIIEQNLAEIIVTTVFLICFSSCANTKQIQEKDCCDKAEIVTQSDYYTNLDCANCDEID